MAASKFAMPAMSPTMDKGGIVDWKVKEGEAFSSGDVLLEVETDKAQIDVEAQDDGIMAKILVQNGAKDIPVGQTIAFLAEPEDDVSKLEFPEPDVEQPKKQAETAEAPKKSNEPEKKVDDAKPSTSSTSGNGAGQQSHSGGSVSVTADPKQTLFPSVAGLLSANNITPEEAFKQIKATGPNGRLLKGDVLSFLGKIPKEAPESIAKYFKSGEALDLSNIKATPIAKEEPEKPAGEAAAKPSTPEPKILKQSFDLSPIIRLRTESLGKVKPFTVYEYVNEAAEKAQAYALQRHAVKSDHYDDLFEDIVSIPSNIERFQISLKINYQESKAAAAAKPAGKPSIFDLLTEVQATNADTNTEPEVPSVDVELLINEKVADAEEKAGLFFSKFDEYLSFN